MANLTDCIRRAGKALDKKDADSIKSLRDDLKSDGMKPQDAAIKATILHIGDLKTSRKALVDALDDAYGLNYAPLVNFNRVTSSMPGMAPEHSAGDVEGKARDPENKYPAWTKGDGGKGLVIPAAGKVPTISAEDFTEMVSAHDWLFPEVHEKKERVALATKEHLGQAKLWTKDEQKPEGVKEGYYKGPGNGVYISEKEAKGKLAGWKAHAKSQQEAPEGFTHYPGRGSNASKLVISLFDLSGNWAKPYLDAGYEVLTFDIQSGQDIMDFSVEYFTENHDINDVFAIFAACPCTDFASSGSKHFDEKDADGRTEASKELVFRTMQTIEYFRPQIWALENPVGRIQSETGLPNWRLGFHPHNFGEDYTKKTLLWGNFNPNLETANVIPTAGSKMFTSSGGKSIETKNERSETPETFAYSFFQANNALDMTPEQYLTTKYTNIAPTIREALKQGMTEAQIDAVVSEYWDFDGGEAQEALIDAMAGEIPEEVSKEAFASKGGISEKVIEDATEGARQGHAYDLTDADMDSYRAGLRGEPQPVPADADIAFELGLLYQDGLQHREEILDDPGLTDQAEMDRRAEDEKRLDKEYLAEERAKAAAADVELEEQAAARQEAQEWSDFTNQEDGFGKFARERETEIISTQIGEQASAVTAEIAEMNAKREAEKQAWRKDRYSGELGAVRKMIDPWVTVVGSHALTYRLPMTTSKRSDRDSIRKGAGPLLKSVGAKVSGDPEQQLERLKAIRLGVNMALEHARHGMFITKYTDEVIGNAAFQLHKGRGADVYNTNTPTQNREAILKSVYRGIPDDSFEAYVAGEKGEWESKDKEATAEKKPKRPLKTKARAKSYGTKNKVFTESAAEKARAAIKAKLGTLNSGIDPELMQAGVTLAGYHIEAGARKFADFASAMIEDLGEGITPYLRSFYESVRYYPGADTEGMSDAAESDLVYTELKEKQYAEREPRAAESDSGNRADDVLDAGENIPDGNGGRSGSTTSETSQGASGNAQGAGAPVDMFGAPAAGESSDNSSGTKRSKPKRGSTRGADNIRSRPDSTGGLLAEQEDAAAVDSLLEQTPDVIPAPAETAGPVRSADLSQVKKQMPFLTEGQAEDVVFAEKRLTKEDGFGVLFTNGTGTGKTFSGLGIAKRMIAQGKGNILIIAPKQPIVSAWIDAGNKFFGIDISKLKDTKDAGKGVVVTTYANLGDNTALMSRDWDAVIADEAHYLASNAKGDSTKPLSMLRGMAMKRGTERTRARAKNPELAARIDELAKAARYHEKMKSWTAAKDLQAQLDPLLLKMRELAEAEKELIAGVKDADKPRAIFLSATPFAYDKTVRWANEFLFDWGADPEGNQRYNGPDKYEEFMMTNFGYRMRYNKLTEPDAKVDSGLMQRAFNTWLKKEGALSGRGLDSDFDYDRKFVMSDSALGRRVDEALEFLRGDGIEDESLRSGFSQLAEYINGQFDYHSRMYFLEGMKAVESIDYIKQHLGRERNVLVMHDYKKGGFENPFKISFGEMDESNANAQEAYALFSGKFSDLISAFDRLPSVIDTMQENFPDAKIYNGDYSAKKRVAIQDEFNDDDDGARLIIAQGDAMREGVSIHDTSGKHPRVLIHLGMPVKPTASIQQEGRIYRTGQASDAMFRYFTIGTNWERFAFADKIAGRAGAAENLAMGEQARGLKESFINAYEDADSYPAGFEGEGKGGKEYDRSLAGSLTPWDIAKSYYFGSKKQGKGRSARGREQSEFFATPEPLGMKMVQWADLRGGEQALEPSAGNGAIGRFFPENTTNRAIEYVSELSSKLALHFDGDVQTGDFMDHNIVNKYDAIVMNPPFGKGGKQAADHIRKAIKHLRDGGRIVALIPTGPAADKQFDKLLYGLDAAPNVYMAAEIALPRVTFERAGTNIPSKVIVLEKQVDPDIAAKIQQTNRDYSEAETIEQFFDRLETSEIPARQESAKSRSEAPTSRYDTPISPEKASDPGFTTMDSSHSKTGDPLFVVNMSRDMGDNYDKYSQMAKDNGGFYIRARMRNWYKPNGGGTIEGKPTFTFKSAGDRAAFLADVDLNSGSARASKPGYLSVDQVQKIADRLTTGKTKLANISVLQSMDDMPEARVTELRKQGVGSISGYYHRPTGEIYLIADGLRSARSVQVTLLHEAIGHRGIERMMGDDFDSFLRMVHDAKNTDQAVADMYERIEQDYPNASPGTKASEVIAFMAEDMPNNSFVRKAIKWIRSFLRKIGFTVPFTNRDIIDALHRAHDQVRQGDFDGAGGEGVAFQAAYHGSPHRHDKFSTNNIGTGEGNAAYGWGMYFAQKRQVAEFYRDALSRIPPVHYRNKPLDGTIPNKWSQAHIRNIAAAMQEGGTFEQHKADSLGDLEARLDSARVYNPDDVADIEESLRFLKALKGSDITTGGTLYEVEVPEDNELLDWDAPLVQQTNIFKKLKPIIEFLEKKGRLIDMQSVTGEQLYNRLTGEMHIEHGASVSGEAQRLASEALAAEGIPGLRYFDDMSRNQSPDVPEFESWAGYFKGADLDNISDWELDDLRSEYQEFVDMEDNRTRNFVIFDDEQVAITDTLFRVRDKAPPKKTVTAYKLFRMNKRFPGKLFPLFVMANDEVPPATWLDADMGERNEKGKVKSKIGPLAFRPGWHTGDSPIATHIGLKTNKTDKAPTTRNPEHVWAEVEVGDDVDWQTEANKRAERYKNGPRKGKVKPVTAHITDQVPEDGFYRYKTNHSMLGNWIIAGTLKVKRLLTDAQVEEINAKHGYADLKRDRPLDFEEWGFGPDGDLGGDWDQGDMFGRAEGETTDELESRLSKLDGVKTLFLSESGDEIRLGSIIIKDDSRKSGVGSQVMQELVTHADRLGKRVTLSPGTKDDHNGTTSRSRLVKFYKQFGFVENKGRNKDFAISDGMYREPAPGGAARASASGFGGTQHGENTWDYLVRKWQDKMRPLLLTQRDIENVGGNISEDIDTYRAEESFYGKAEDDLRKLKERYLEPLAASMARNNIKQEELDDYLTARHARERNAHIASINPDMPDGGSGMTDQESRGVLAAFRAEGKDPALAEAAQYVYDLLKKQRDLKRSLQGDAITDTWEAKYNHYVPLKGLASDEESFGISTGRGFDIRGKESKRALGRQSRSESPVMHSIKDTTDAVIRYRKNEVGNVFLAMVQANPDPDYWRVYTDANPDKERRVVKTAAGDVVKEMPVAMHLMKDTYFATKKDGITYFIKLSDQRLIHAMQNLGPESLNVILRGMNTVTRFLSSMSTSYNPEFMVSNMARDIQTAVLNLLAEQDLHDGKAQGHQLAGKMVKSVPRAIRAIHASLYSKELTGENAEWQRTFDQFREDGAKTGWFDQKDVEGQADELAHMITVAQGGAKGGTLKFIQLVKDVVEHSNTAVENGVRLSVYKHAIDSGVSRKQAASLAKNLTVNFNRKGEIGGALNSAYMFANASIQGTANFGRTMATFKKDANGKRKMNMAQKAGAALVGGAFALAMLNRFMSGDDDDGENWYDKVPQHVRERNIVIMKSVFGGPEQEYYTIPLPYGYNVFYNLGDTAEAALNSDYRSNAQLASGLAMALAGSFSPIGLESSDRTEVALAKTFVPTVLSPIVQLGFNENFYGAPIYRENGQYDVPAPDSALTKRSTKAHWKAVSKFMNEATGGSDFRSGWADVSPDTLGHLFDFTTGSAGAFYSRSADAVKKAAQGADMEDREIPFYRKVSGKVMPYEDSSRFYERRDELAQLSKEFKSLSSDKRDAFRGKYDAKLKLGFRMKAADKQLANLRKMSKTVEASRSLSHDEKQERLDRIQVKKDAVIDKFNLKYSEAE